MAIGDVFGWLTGKSSQNQQSESNSSLQSSEAQQVKQDATKTQTGTTQSNSTANTQANQVSNQSATTTGTTGTQQTGTANTQQQQSLSSLDSGTIQALTNLIGDKVSNPSAFFSGDSVGAAQSNKLLADFIAERAKTGGTELANATAAAKAEEIQNFERGTMADVLTAADRTGSIDNSFVQLLANRGREDLSVRLANIEAQALLKGRELNTNELNMAMAAGSEAAGGLREIDKGKSQQTLDIARLVEQLKGANVTGSTAGQTTTGQTTTTESESATLSEILNSLSQSSEAQSNQTSTLQEILSSLATSANEKTAAGTNTNFTEGSRQGSLFDIINLTARI